MQRQLTITLDAATLQGLKDQDYALYVFAAVRYGPRLTQVRSFGGGYPLVWSRLETYLTNTDVTFDDGLPSAYVSTTPLVENAVVQVGSSDPTGPGQTVVVDQYGQLTGLTTGSPGTISIHNTGETAWTCGLLLPLDQASMPICAFPLHGGAMDMIAPTARILVMFAINSIPPGSAVSTAYSDGLLIDFSGETQRAVGFDIDKGWSADTAVWARDIPAGSDIGALLITN